MTRPAEVVAPLVVIDTNAVLDWLLFADPAGLALGEAVADGRLCWIATPAMRAEHFEVLRRGALAKWAPDEAAHHRAWDGCCSLRPSPPTAAAAGTTSRIRSADPADQMFVDLALAERAAWLVSRDRALLELAGALRREGVTVATPGEWARLAPPVGRG